MRIEHSVRAQPQPDATIAEQQQSGGRIAECHFCGVVAAILGLSVDLVPGKADDLAGLGRWRVKKSECHADFWRISGNGIRETVAERSAS